ncbi:MAG: PQQ-binding-like beta-propeller repeat protein, partial [Planctomycetota bacterium]
MGVFPAEAQDDSAKSIGPWDLPALLSQVPEARWLDRQNSVHSLVYQGETFGGRQTEVFAYYASPQTLGRDSSGKRFPGVVLIHGGGGTAFANWTYQWAQRGYAAIAMDLSGSRPPEPEFSQSGDPGHHHRHNRMARTRLPGGGPDHGAKQKFDSIGGSHDDDWPYHAAANVIRAHSLLRSFPDIDADRTAVTGISWGGYTTCLVASLDHRFKAAVPVYGCGFLHEGDSVQKPQIDRLGDRAPLWVATYDPGSLLPHCRVPILFVNGTNDKHYPLDSYMKSFDAVAGPKQLCVTVNMPHGHQAGWERNEIELFIDSHCNDGVPLPVIHAPKIRSSIVFATVESKTPISKGQLHYTTDDGIRSQRQWVSRDAKIRNGNVITEQPPANANTWYVSVTDARGAVVSSPIQFVSPTPTDVRNGTSPLSSSGWEETGDDWMTVGGDRGCMRYSTLDQISRDNVAKLERAWTFRTGELVDGKGKTIECTPVVVDGVAYVTTANRRLLALDGATGKVIWEFDPAKAGPLAGPLASGGVNRGVAYWSDGIPGGQRRILHGVSDGRLFSVDARTGALDPKFGNAGTKDLREDLERDVARLGYGPTSAPAICGDTVILGVSNGEGPNLAAPGDVRAFDVRSGKQLWRFHTVPRPGELGHDTWQGESWKNRGGANAWGGASVDPQRGLVFVGLGSAAFDFYGGDRHGDNLFANCVVAIDAKTGQRRWHFQTIRHDLWDHDLPVYPNLVTVTHGGQEIPAVAQVTKTGYVYLLDRETGKPLFPIKEISVPSSDVPGELAAKTQPIPTKPPPFSAQFFDERNVTNIAAANRQFVLDQLGAIRGGPAFNPPSLKGTVVIPWFHGGANWSGACFDPTSGILYVNSTNIP